jgi:16S rRNA (cytidine1402-2'-O)-methyltransferase
VTGSLVLVCTPIGNLADLSPRAAEALGAADFWLVEDTRVSARLLSHLGFKKPMSVLNDHSDDSRIDRYLAEIKGGKNAALLSDGGAPVISDPGARLTDRCLDEGVPVDAIPGPSAVTNAIMLSGFFGQRYAFLGFLPRKAGAIRGQLAPFAESPLPIVLFESPFRLETLLTTAHEALGERRYAICREMTKMHQQIFRATLPIIPSEAEVMRKGEVTIVIEGKRKGYQEAE